MALKRYKAGRKMKAAQWSLAANCAFGPHVCPLGLKVVHPLVPLGLALAQGPGVVALGVRFLRTGDGLQGEQHGKEENEDVFHG